MTALEKGITKNGTGYSGKTWNILGQVYFPKAVTDSTFAFETNSDPGQFVPVHIHPTQDEFILVQDGMLDLKLDGVWIQAKAVGVTFLWSGIVAAISYKLVDLTIGLRVTEEEEREGLDTSSHGEAAYRM